MKIICELPICQKLRQNGECDFLNDNQSKNEFGEYERVYYCRFVSDCPLKLYLADMLITAGKEDVA